jgi:hypothetical protein
LVNSYAFWRIGEPVLTPITAFYVQNNKKCDGKNKEIAQLAVVCTQ